MIKNECISMNLIITPPLPPSQTGRPPHHGVLRPLLRGGGAGPAPQPDPLPHKPPRGNHRAYAVHALHTVSAVYLIIFVVIFYLITFICSFFI